jgi:hypothetical protein
MQPVYSELGYYKSTYEWADTMKLMNVHALLENMLRNTL